MSLRVLVQVIHAGRIGMDRCMCVEGGGTLENFCLRQPEMTSLLTARGQHVTSLLPGQSSQMIATFVGSQFVRIAPNRPSLKLFNIYGLQFDLQAQQEYGTYSLHVNIIRNNSLARDSKYIYVGSPGE